MSNAFKGAMAMAIAASGGVSMGQWLTYTQVVEVECATAEDAEKVELHTLQLPPGKILAFSTRWDDTFPHNAMIDALADNGYKGTFYLNKVDEGFARSVIDHAIKRGSSVGAHTVNHPHLPQISPNDRFREIMANRIDIESFGNVCVSSFTLPYMSYKSDADPDAPAKVAACLLRAGLFGGDEIWPDVASMFKLSPKDWIGAFTFGINDKDPQLDLFRKNIAEGKAKIAAGQMECGPHLSLGIHSWQQDMGKFRDIIATEAQHGDWWYCNANEYLAFSIQMYHTAIKKTGVTGRTARFEITRIVPYMLGDRIGMGLKASEMPKAVLADGRGVKIEGGGEFMLPHDASQQLPAKIMHIHNQANIVEPDEGKTSPELQGVQTALSFAQAVNRLTCVIKNVSADDLSDIVITFRAPPKWRSGVAVRKVGVLKAGETKYIDIELGETDGDPANDVGKYYFAAQCDMLASSGRVRVYATTEVEPIVNGAVAGLAK